MALVTQEEIVENLKTTHVRNVVKSGTFRQPHIVLRIGLVADVYFSGLGKLKNYQLKLNIDESITHVAQPVRRISFRRREEFVKETEWRCPGVS